MHFPGALDTPATPKTKKHKATQALLDTVTLKLTSWSEEGEIQRSRSIVSTPFSSGKSSANQNSGKQFGYHLIKSVLKLFN